MFHIIEMIIRIKTENYGRNYSVERFQVRNRLDFVIVCVRQTGDLNDEEFTAQIKGINGIVCARNS